MPLEGFGFPPFSTDQLTTSHLRESSALIVTGGDNLTLDYGVMSLYQWARFVDNARSMGVPAILWAGSVAPFSGHAAVEKVMARHLQQYEAITVRETISLDYLKSIGVEQVKLVADPAFTLVPQAFDIVNTLAVDFSKPVLGFNVSPLIRRFRSDEASAKAMDREIISFLQYVTSDTDFSLVLVPHVDPLNGAEYNSDWHYMNGLLSNLSQVDEKIVFAPPTLNTCELKYLIRKCDYFIGARTHATIAALSQKVPTVSIAYSAKAKGINVDLLGSQRYLVETPKVSEKTLKEAFALLQTEEATIRTLLGEKLPEWHERALGSVDALKSIVHPVRAEIVG